MRSLNRLVQLSQPHRPHFDQTTSGDCCITPRIELHPQRRHAPFIGLNFPASVTNRNAAIALVVALLHAAFIYGLSSSAAPLAIKRVPQTTMVLVPPVVEPPKPRIEPAPAPPPAQPAQAAKKAASPTPAAAVPAPKAIAVPALVAVAPGGQAAPQTAAAPVAAAPAATSAAPAAPAAPAVSASVQLPSSNADYLQNPKPAYPALSQRLNEQGTTIVRVLIGSDGVPERADISKSSGFARLDSAAVSTALRWRYVPGKRGGVPEAMSFDVPIKWSLTE